MVKVLKKTFRCHNIVVSLPIFTDRKKDGHNSIKLISKINFMANWVHKESAKLLQKKQFHGDRDISLAVIPDPAYHGYMKVPLKLKV